MPPKRRQPNRIPLEEANERDRMAQLEQQVAQLTEQIATLIANQNHPRDVDGSEEESGDEEEVPQQRRRPLGRDDGRR